VERTGPEAAEGKVQGMEYLVYTAETTIRKAKFTFALSLQNVRDPSGADLQEHMGCIGSPGCCRRFHERFGDFVYQSNRQKEAQC
jgi:hypothetical protein